MTSAVAPTRAPRGTGWRGLLVAGIVVPLVAAAFFALELRLGYLTI